MRKRLTPKEALRKRLDEGMPKREVKSYKRAYNRAGRQLRKSNGH